VLSAADPPRVDSQDDEGHTDPGAAHCHASGSVVTAGDLSRKRLPCSKRIWVSRSEHAPTRPSA